MSHCQTCQLSLIQSATQANEMKGYFIAQAIAPSKIRPWSEKEWENCPNFDQLYMLSLNKSFKKLPHFQISLNCPISGWQVWPMSGNLSSDRPHDTYETRRTKRLLSGEQWQAKFTSLYVCCICVMMVGELFNSCLVANSSPAPKPICEHTKSPYFYNM